MLLSKKNAKEKDNWPKTKIPKEIEKKANRNHFN